MVIVGAITVLAAAQAPPDPRLEFSTWGMPGSARFVVVLGASGLLEVSREGPGTQGRTVRTESLQLEAAVADRLVSLAAEADDFDAECRTAADGTSARLKVLVAGKLVVRTCEMARQWPAGPKTRQFLDRLNKLLPSELNVY
jgi:hypothetical protein